jgi:hypothetical protein
MTTAKSKTKKSTVHAAAAKEAVSRRQDRTDPDRPWLRRPAEGVGRQVYRCQAGPVAPRWLQGRRQGGVQGLETNSPEAAGLAKNLPLRRLYPAAL